METVVTILIYWTGAIVLVSVIWSLFRLWEKRLERKFDRHRNGFRDFREPYD